MKGKIIAGSGSAIAPLYILLIILAVGGFSRAGVINGAVNFFGFKNGNVNAVLLFIFCVTELMLYYIVISKGRTMP